METPAEKMPVPSVVEVLEIARKREYLAREDMVTRRLHPEDRAFIDGMDEAIRILKENVEP